MKAFMRWLTTPCPWWEFWNPQSGPVGGLLGGLVLWSLIGLVHFVLKWLQ